MTTTNELQPGRLKSGRITGSNNIPKILGTPRLTSSSAKIKKGRRAGTIMENHNLNPEEAAFTVS